MGEEQSCDGALKQEVEEKWHKSKDDQVSAPLILDPTSGNMAKEMKAVSRKFEEVTGSRVPVAGTKVSSIAKAEPLRKVRCERGDCFPCTTGGNIWAKKKKNFSFYWT